MSKSINILHITDLHLDDKLIEDFDLLIRKPLKEDVNKRTNGKLDLVFITGDIVNLGGKELGGTYQGLKTSNEKVIQIIADNLNVPKESIFIVPGNHDIDRKADEKITELGLIEHFKEQKQVNDFIDGINKGKNYGVQRLEDYWKFEKEFYANYTCRKGEPNFFFSPTFIKEIDTTKIGISCLNSSWRCFSSKEDKGRLLLGDTEIYRSLKLIEKCDIKIALIHHHIDHLAEFQRIEMETILLKEYDIVFFGHSHDSNNYFKVRGNNPCIWIGSPAGFCNARTDSRKNASGYSLCTINIENTTIQYAYYSNVNKEFRDNTEVGSNGKDVFHSLIKDKELTTPITEPSSDPSPISSTIDDLESHNIPKTVFDNQLNDFRKPSTLFRGRVEQLAKLKKDFEENEVVTITGIGGIGKTELVIKFLDDLGEEQRERITWQDFRHGTLFDNFVLAAGFGVIIQHNKGEREKFSAFLDKIKEFNRIIIWEDFHGNQDDTYLRFLDFAKGKLGAAKLIIISRTDAKISHFAKIELHDFKESEEYAKALLADRFTNLSLSTEVIRQICRYVKGHPFAIKLALNLCKSIPVDKVIGKLSRHRKGGDELSQRLFEEILKEDSSQEEKDFLYQFSIFKGRASKEIIEAIFGEECFFGVLSSLSQKYLISFEEGYYDTHPLIREFCYQKLSNKKELHTKVSTWLIAQRGDKLDFLLEERIFHHLKGAEDYEAVNQTIEFYGREYVTQAFFEPLIEMIEFVQRKMDNTPLHNLLIGEYYDLLGNWDKALSFYSGVKDNSIDKNLAIEGLLKIGDIHTEMGDNDEALTLYYKAEKASENQKNQKYIAWSYNAIASIKIKLGDFNEAFELHLKALDISKEINIKKDIATLYNNLGLLYQEKNFSQYNLKKAFDYYYLSLLMKLEIRNKSGIANTYNNIGVLYSYKNYSNYNTDKTFEYYNKSLEISTEIGDKHSIANSYSNFGVLYFDLIQYENAFFYLFKSLAILSQLKANDDIKSNKNYILSCKQELGNKEFNQYVQAARNRLEPEYQKEINLSEFTNIPYVASKKYKRNDPVKVKYTNGTIIEKKYKQVQNDIKAGKCEII